MTTSMILLNRLWGLTGPFEMINIHPLLVHFPVALLPAALVFYILGAALKKDSLLGAGMWSLIAGTVGAAGAVWTGLQAEGSVPHGGSVHDLMEAHEMLGFVILGLSVLLMIWTLLAKAHLPKKGRAAFFVLLLVLNGVLVQSADLGGRMVYLNGVGVGHKSMVAEADAHAGHDHEGHSHP